jgi:hypothetical protein
MLERPRLMSFTLQLNQAVFSPLPLSDHHLSAKTYSFRDVVPGHLENQGEHLFGEEVPD